MMKNILTVFVIFIALNTNAQIFWTENFTGSSVGTGTVVSSYSGPNGAWGLTTGLTTEGPNYNQWYVSCQEAGHITGGCGSTCGASGDIGATLHVGSTTLGDWGASYDAGGLTNPTTDRRAESPTINCTGRYTITLRFYYILTGQTGIDYANVWYNDGTGWALLTSPAVTTTCGGGQGIWNFHSVALPSTANNNPNVKIGFRWINNNDGLGNDPSFAVDSINLSAATSTATPVPSYTVTPGLTVCEGSCLFFDNTTTGAIDSLRWSWSGGLMAATDTMTMCYMASGTFPITLTVYKSGTPYTTTRTVTVNPAPAAIAGAHAVCVGITTPLTNAVSGGTWTSASTSIATVGSSTGIVSGVAVGATTITYSLSSGCYATYSMTVHPTPCTLGIVEMNGNNSTAQIFPNPANDELIISITQNAFTNYDITNELGQSLIQAPLNILQTKVDIKVLPAGMYYIRLRGAGGSVVQRFVKE
ncbi:MAG: domain containing protein [Flavipsychrobacter sp.]|nr:domain containing protein [Flavipsychrobacter sp.]